MTVRVIDLSADEASAEAYDERCGVIHDVLDDIALTNQMATCCVAAQMIVDLMGVVAVYEARTPPTEDSQADIRTEAERRTGKTAARVARARRAH